MGLDNDTMRKVNTVCHQINNGKINADKYEKMLQNSMGNDFEFSYVLATAKTRSSEKYDAELEHQLLGDVKDGVKTSEREDWFLKDFLVEEKNKIYDSEKYVKDFLGPEVRAVAKDFNNRLNTLEKNMAKEFGIDRMELSRFAKLRATFSR